MLPLSPQPTNKDYTLPAGELPPLLVQIHGGPTARTGVAYSLAKQYWTSRGTCDAVPMLCCDVYDDLCGGCTSCTAAVLNTLYPVHTVLPCMLHQCRFDTMSLHRLCSG